MATKTGKLNFDLYAEIQQSTCDKLLGSVSYPFTVLEQRQDFPQSKLQLQNENGFYTLTKPEIEVLFKSSVSKVRNDNSNEPSVGSQVYSFAGSLIQQAKAVIEASVAAGSDYEGPDVSGLEAVVNGGIDGLVSTLGDFDISLWCSYLKIRILNQPKLGLGTPKIDLTNVKISVTATGEIWAKHPWWNCYKWCTKWEKIHKYQKVASVTITLDIKAEAHAVILAKGTSVTAVAEFDKLRLAYDILDKIPLEGLANKELAGKPVFVYDAAQLVSTVPILKTRFGIENIVIPNNPSGIGIGVNLKTL